MSGRLSEKRGKMAKGGNVNYARLTRILIIIILLYFIGKCGIVLWVIEEVLGSA